MLMTLTSLANGDIQDQYNDYIMIRIYPDDSAMIDMKGTIDGDRSIISETPFLEELDLKLESLSREEITLIRNEFMVKFDASNYITLTGMYLDLKGGGNSTRSDLAFKVIYPGVCEANGSLNLTSITPPNNMKLELGVTANIYYEYLPKDEAPLIIQAIPFLKPQIEAELKKSTGGNLTLNKIEVQGYKEYPEYGQLALSVCLSGDFQKGIQYMIDNMQTEIDLANLFEANYVTSIESYNYNLTFGGSSLTLEGVSEVSIKGDFDEQINEVKNSMLQQLINNERLDENSEELASNMLTIDVSVRKLNLDLHLTTYDDSFSSAVDIKGLGLKPGSLNTFVNCMKNVSNSTVLENYKIIMEGVSTSGQYVKVDSLVGEEESVVEEENKVVLNMDHLTDLDEISYSVSTKQSQVLAPAIIASFALGLLILGVIVYFKFKK